MKKIEIIGKRGPREKHFLQEDGTFLAEMYDEDVHFLKNGQYEEINSQLSLEGDYYINNKNDFDILFSARPGNELMKLMKKNKYINISLNKCNVFSIDKIENSNKFYDCITYSNVLDGVDLKYEIIMSKIKESIIINNKESKIDELCFNITTNADLKMSEKGTIIVNDEENKLFEFELPFLIDANNLINENISYNLIKDNDNYQLFILLDKNWMNNKATYPIIIDPTITNYTNDNNLYDTYIFNGDTGYDRNSSIILKAGVERENGNDIINRTLLKFDLPTLGTGSQVIKAALNLTHYPDPSNDAYEINVVNIHRVTDAWDEATANWNSMNNKFDSRVDGTFECQRYYYTNEQNQIIYLCSSSTDITALVQKWYTGTNNYGIMLRASEEVYKNNVIPTFYSKNNVNNSIVKKPYLVISYRNQNGLEKYMNYERQQLSHGCIYHNTYNGNLTQIIDLANTKNSKMPLDLKLVYNTNDVVLNNNSGYGLGFRLNYSQTIKEVNIDNKVYLEYTDSDGTIHYFLNEKVEYINSQWELVTYENTFFDEDGLNLKIEKIETYYILTDKNNNQTKFEIQAGVGYLIEMRDANNNLCIINYDQNHRITSLIDSNNYTINISYTTESNNDVITINSPDNSTTRLVYSDNNLLSISYCNNNDIETVIYENTNNLITKVTDVNNKKVEYEYYEKAPYKLKKVKEYGINNELGKNYSVIYGYNSTKLKNETNKIKCITYNNNGNPNSIAYFEEDNDIRNAFGNKVEFGESINGIDMYKNKVLNESIPLSSVNNLLKNTSFEDNDILFTSDDYVELRIVDGPVNSGLMCLRYGSPLQNESSIYQTISVEGGKYYTFSAYVNTDTWTTPVKLAIGYSDNNNVYHEEISEKIVTSNYERLDTTIYVPDNLTNSEVKIKIILEGTGMCYIDDIQLEEGPIANNYNLIENSDFSDGLSDWTLDSNSGYPVNNVFSVVNIDNVTALKINMFTSNYTDFQKDFNIKGKQGDRFTLSFWYKNKGLNGGVGIFDYGTKNGVSIVFYPEDETIAGDSMIDDFILNPNETEWQFFSCEFEAPFDFRYFNLMFNQSLNANDFYITNINLFKNLPTIKYSYDENGNIIKAKKTENENNFVYDKNKQLVNMIDPKNTSFSYEYDNENPIRVLSGITTLGIINELKYDNNQNITYSKLIHKGIKELESANQYSIRLKGTNKKLSLIDGQIKLIEDYHSHCLWNIDKVTINNVDLYKIYHSIINNKYFSTNNSDYILLTNYDSEYSLFEFVKNDNGSFYIKNNHSNKYLCSNNINNELRFLELNNSGYNYEFYLENDRNKKFIEQGITYTADGRFIKKQISNDLTETDFDFDSNTGYLKSQINKEKHLKEYSYDSFGKLLSVNNNGNITRYTYNINKMLSSIIQDGRVYNFTYNDFLKLKDFKIGNITLLTNNYNLSNGKLESILFGNNQTIEFDYDKFDRLKKMIRSDDTYNYYYDNNGNLSKVISDDNIIKYIYDEAKRLYKYKFDDFEVKYQYDINNNVVNKKYTINNNTYNILNELNNDDYITRVNNNSNIFDYEYDDIGRITKFKINTNYIIEYEYDKNGYRTTNLVRKYSNNGDIYKYNYDKLNRINKIYHNDILEKKYYYDEFEQLIREDDYIENITIRYIYDNLGNILYTKTCKFDSYDEISSNKYEYNNQSWLDQMTKYNNEIITYDNYGNVISIGNDITLNWINGKYLNQYQKQNNVINYKYNESGIRISKKINNVETKYYLENGKIIYEKTNNNYIYYIYSNDKLVGFNYNGTTYYYLKNLHNDIIGILDSNFNLIAKYKYDSWGKILSITDNNNVDVSTNMSHIANINPYRYRSYYYDNETNLYYLNFRYYNPEWKRYLSIDACVNTTDIKNANLYNYCENDPINKIDESGHLLSFLVGAVVTIAKKVIKTVARTIVKACTKVAKKIGLPTAADFLNRSLQDKPTNVCYGNNSEYVDRIINSNAFQTTIKDILDKDPYSCFYNTEKPLTFTSAEKDLHLAFGHTTMSITGDADYASGDFKISIHDVYDYDYLNYLKYPIKYWPVVFINNRATDFQALGIINTYDFYIQFDYSAHGDKDFFYVDDGKRVA